MAPESGPQWGPKNSHTLLNHAIERVDGPAKATGSAKYTYDMRPPGMLFGLVLHSPYAKADVVSVDLTAAKAMPGVKAIYSIGTKRLNYEGDPVAAVAADTPEHAEDALRAIKVRYNKLPHAVTWKQALAPNAPKVYDSDGGVQGNLRPGSTSGDSDAAAAALKTCDAVVEHTFTVTQQHHNCLETHGLVVDYRGGNSAVVYASTQGTFTIPGESAADLGLGGDNAVTAIVEYMGGGFGSKFGIGLAGRIACTLSKMAKAPVRLMLTRPGEYLAAGNGSGGYIKVTGGATRGGKLAAMHAVMYRLGGLGQGSLAGLPYIYNAGTFYREVSSLHTNQDGSVALRAPGHPIPSFAMESMMDDLAAKIDMDPVEFRKQNTGDETYHRQLDTGARAIGWERRNKAPGATSGYGPDGALKRGMGCGLATWGGGGGPQCQVDVFITPDSAVVVQVGTQDLGTGTRTYTAAVIAEELGLPVSAVTARIGHSNYGQANASGGSTTAASLAPALKSAAYNAKVAFLARVAPVVGAAPDALSLANERVFVTADPAKGLTWKQACAALGSTGLSAHGEWVPGLSGNGVHGAHFAEVEVDTETGRVRVIKLVGVQDCGLPLNRLAVKSQINGGMIMGLGMALLETTVADEATGNMLNANMEEFKLPGSMEMPELVPIIDDGDTRNVVIGMAEPANIPASSAIANAVYNACGARVTDLPITPDKVLQALGKVHAS
ncbi:MAG: xanthine dehydrogenase family protein molybdopterin-binding subunit [Armatimonadetes bacterium]|nr:xanthine dehydrogenase family protein molybdopterin-binding subunit [Armatimonadota bacterium]MDE2205627.1 xanthine dehydrogenase family protein molybdopterin-binding subunit [Armatimonadota bacterium]